MSVHVRSRLVTFTAWIVIAFALTACSMGPASAGATEQEAAIIRDPTAQSRAALQKTLARALRRDRVLIADDALTTDDVLIIEPARVRDPSGRLVTDSSVRVEHFRLVKEGNRCVLIQDRTGERFALADTQCAPKP